jgi:phosphoribosyl-ATP pyrophosphohydrolase
MYYKKYILKFTLFFLIIMIMSGCKSSKNSFFIGEWEDEDTKEIIKLEKDGKRVEVTSANNNIIRFTIVSETSKNVELKDVESNLSARIIKEKNGIKLMYYIGELKNKETEGTGKPTYYKKIS